jgi:hypothetical protein
VYSWTATATDGALDGRTNRVQGHTDGRFGESNAFIFKGRTVQALCTALEAASTSWQLLAQWPIENFPEGPNLSESDDIRHQLDIPSVQTAGAPFGQNIVSRGGAETGDKWAKIESAVQCDVEIDENTANGGENTGKVVRPSEGRASK